MASAQMPCETVRVALPSLSLGTTKSDHGPHRSGASARGSPDAIVHSRRLRLARTETRYTNVTGTARRGRRRSDRGGRVRCGRRRYLLLLDLADADSPRLERALAASLLRRSRESYDTIHSEVWSSTARLPGRRRRLAILPYASSDLEASALAAIIGPEQFNASRLEFYLSTISSNQGNARASDRRLPACGLGSAVLPRSGRRLTPI
jgi:hypothetical protein